MTSRGDRRLYRTLWIGSKDIRVRTVFAGGYCRKPQTPELVGDLFRQVKDHVAGIELGVHLHSRPETAEEKILAAYEGRMPPIRQRADRA